jgi:hypothetical protein
MLALPAWGATTVVTPGTGTLSAAITAATDGDTLILQSGAYVESATMTIQKNLILKGEGRPAIQAGAASFTLFSVANGYDLTLKNLVVDANAHNGIGGIDSTTASGTVSGCEFQNLNYVLGTSWPSGNWTISGNYFTMLPNASFVLRFNGAGNIQVTDNTFYMPTAFGGNPGSYVVSFTNAGGVISNNTFYTNQQQVADAMIINNSSIVTVANNTITGFAVGINVQGTALVTARNNYLASNTLAIQNASTMPVDAQFNFWGTIDPIAIAALVSGS